MKKPGAGDEGIAIDDPHADKPVKAVKRRFRDHVGHYAWAEMVAAGIGLLSFPILTRLLSVADYGTMNLVASALALSVAFGKAGMQHAILRGWAEVDAGHSPHSKQTFEATVLWGMASMGLVATLLWLVMAGAIPQSWWGEPGVAAMMLLATPLVLLRVLDSALANLMRAQELSRALAVYNSVRRVAVFVVVVGVLWGLSRDLKGFFIATLLAELLAILVLLGWMFRGRASPRPTQLSRPLLVSLAVFGLPMLGSELATVVLIMGDRFLIQNQLGAQSLGIYAATFNMCDQLRGALLGALVGAAYPRCMALWENQGRVALQQFLKQFMHYYALAAIFMVALMATVGSDLMVVLASQKYAAGGPLAGWIMAGLAIQTVGTVAAVGIFIAKRSLLAMSLLLAAGLLSIAANMVLIPWVGLAGAGWTVAGTSAALCAMQLLAARKHAPVVVPWRALLTFGAVAAVGVTLVNSFGESAGWARLMGRAFALGSVYLAAVLALDKPARHWLLSRLHAIGRR
jgi:O-antigen/teichoic acid export membrane protein